MCFVDGLIHMSGKELRSSKLKKNPLNYLYFVAVSPRDLFSVLFHSLFTQHYWVVDAAGNAYTLGRPPDIWNNGCGIEPDNTTTPHSTDCITPPVTWVSDMPMVLVYPFLYLYYVSHVFV